MSQKIKQLNKISSDEHGTCRIFNGDNFAGTSMIYAITENDQDAFQADFRIKTLEETHPDQTRAYREARKARGEGVLNIPNDQLKHEAVVLFGPDMTPNQAIAALRRLASKIENEGLLIGCKKKCGVPVIEYLDGRIEDQNQLVGK